MGAWEWFPIEKFVGWGRREKCRERTTSFPVPMPPRGNKVHVPLAQGLEVSTESTQQPA